MSDLRIALVAEGPTDEVIIKAALKAILPSPFVVTLLQPESTRPEMGGGWCGVFKWCRELHQRGYASFEVDPTLELFDLFIVHLDADVADKSYADCGEAVALAAAGLSTLPCAVPCPPPGDTVNRLKDVLLSWLGMNTPSAKTILRIPSKASEAWLAAALFQGNDDFLAGTECEMNMVGILANLPKAHRIRKSVPQYQAHTPAITRRWTGVKEHCSQAARFHQELVSAMQSLTP